MIDTSKKIILVGPGASGKDHIKLMLCDKLNLKPSISHTTRPPRPGEVDGIDYHFIDKPQFELMIKKHCFIEYQSFGQEVKHYYGTSKDTWEKSNLFIMTPRGIEDMYSYRNDMFIIYLNPSEIVRGGRMAQRVMFEEVRDRLKSDRADFKDFNTYDLKITNHDF